MKNTDDEYLMIDGSKVSFPTSSEATTLDITANNFQYLVSYVLIPGYTDETEYKYYYTVTITKAGDFTELECNTLINGLKFGVTPCAQSGDRYIEITGIIDNGGTAHSGINERAMSNTDHQAKVTVTHVDLAPSITATGKKPIYYINGTEQLLFDVTALDPVESTQIINGVAIYVSNVTDSGEALVIDGTVVALTDGNVGTTTGFNELAYSVLAVSGTVTVTLTKADMAENWIMYLNAISYKNTTVTATAGTDLTLSGTVAPTNATNKTIIWSVKDAGMTGATIDDNKLSTTASGTVTVTATITDGTALGTVYTKDFTIVVSATPNSNGGGHSGSRGNLTTDGSSATVSTENNTTTIIQTLTAKTGSDGVATASVTKDQFANMMKVATEKVSEQNTKKSLEIKVESSSANVGVSVTIPQTAASSLIDGVNWLTIFSPTVTVTFDEKALAEIGENANGDITFKEIKPEDTALSDEDKAIIGTRPVCDLKITTGSTAVSSFGGGTATVSVPYTPAPRENVNAIVAYYVDASGELVTVPNCVYDGKTGTVTFTTTHFSTYAVGYNKVSFSDVSGSAWYADYVTYLALYRYAEYKGKVTKSEGMAVREFGDYANGSSWAQAPLQWAINNRILSGNTDGNFAPQSNATRAQAAQMLVVLLQEMNGN